MNKCPKCGTEILIPAPVCVQCGADLTKEDSSDLSSKWTNIDITKTEETKILCPNCNKSINSLLTSICPHCGVSLGQEKVKVEESKQVKEEPKPKEKEEITPITKSPLFKYILLLAIIVILVLIFIFIKR